MSRRVTQVARYATWLATATSLVTRLLTRLLARYDADEQALVHLYNR